MIFHTKYPKFFAPPSARPNFFKCAPLPWNPGSAPALGTNIIIKMVKVIGIYCHCQQVFSYIMTTRLYGKETRTDRMNGRSVPYIVQMLDNSRDTAILNWSTHDLIIWKMTQDIENCRIVSWTRTWFSCRIVSGTRAWFSCRIVSWTRT